MLHITIKSKYYMWRFLASFSLSVFWFSSPQTLLSSNLLHQLFFFLICMHVCVKKLYHHCPPPTQQLIADTHSWWAAKEPDISLRSWWRPKTELKGREYYYIHHILTPNECFSVFTECVINQLINNVCCLNFCFLGGNKNAVLIFTLFHLLTSNVKVFLLVSS